jgi:hypothetical protein
LPLDLFGVTAHHRFQSFCICVGHFGPSCR